MSNSKAEALEPFRSYLEVLARAHLDPRLRGKLEPADLVQQVLLRACAAWPELKNPEGPALLAWLRRILARTLADVVKHYDRDKRAVDLERSLEADLDRSCRRCSAEAAGCSLIAARKASTSGRGRWFTGRAPGRGPSGGIRDQFYSPRAGLTRARSASEGQPLACASGSCQLSPRR